jgi:RecB family exonuclease
VAVSSLALAFVADASLWCRSGSSGALERIFRSPFSGVAHDVAAAYVTLAHRTGSLLEVIERERLALPAADRDAVFAFVRRANALRDRAAATGDDETKLANAIGDVFPEAFPLAETSDGRLQDDLALDLAPAPEPEPATGIRARQSHFSASALNAYAECPRKWYYRYACSSIEDAGSSASYYGTAFHLALEDFHATFSRPSAVDELAMRERIVDDVTWAFERHRNDFATPVEFTLQVRRAQRTAQRYIDWLVAESKRAPFEVIGRETPANLVLGGHAFVGFIDRLDLDDRSGGVRVVDYKTGSIATSASEYRDKVRRFRDFQLPFYYWARTQAGDRVTTLALLPLKDALVEVRPVALEVVATAGAEARGSSTTGTIALADLERAKVRMIELCDELTSGSVDRFAVTGDPEACTYCAYAVACAHRPPAQREHFGR